MFMTFEGIDGCGKTTAINGFAKYLREIHGDNVLQTKGLGDTEVGERVRAILLDMSLRPTPLTEMLLIAAQRAQHFSEVVWGAEAHAADHILMDRYIHSTFAYQVHAKKNSRKVFDYLNTLVAPVKIDLTFYLKVDPSIARQRSVNRAALDRFEKESDMFFKKVQQGYDKFVSSNFVVIDANQPPEDVLNQIIDVYQAHVNNTLMPSA